MDKVRQLKELLEVTSKGGASALETRLLNSSAEFFNLVKEIETSDTPTA